MANFNAEFRVSLAGRGYVDKTKGNFLPGEYDVLSNVEIDDDGGLKERNKVLRLPTIDNDLMGGMDNGREFIGEIEGRVFVASKTRLGDFKKDSSSGAHLVLESDLTPKAAGDEHIFVKLFEYGGNYYILSFLDTSGGTKSIYLWSYPSSEFGITSVLAVSALASWTSTLLLTEAVWWKNLYPKASFIHKDRLWIASGSTLYWSKATDPTVFAVPDGGFVTIPSGEGIVDAISLGDTVYLLTSESVYTLSYSSDPSADGYLRKYVNVGGSSMAIHNGSLYVMGRNNIYLVSNGFANRILDLPRLAGNDYYYKIVSYNKYLVFITRDRVYYTDGESYDLGFQYPLGLIDSPNFYVSHLLFFLNMENGSMFTLDITDQKDAVAPAEVGYPVDIYVTDDGTLYILMNARQADIPAYPGSRIYGSFQTNVYNYDEDSLLVYDKLWKADNLHASCANYKPAFDVQFDSLTPDGSEFKMKKFRGLRFMGRAPFRDFQVTLAYDNNDFNDADAININQANFTGMRLHSPYRLPLNQRARSISVRFKATDVDTPLTDTGSGLIYDQFRLSNLSLYWSPTNRQQPFREQNSTHPGDV